MATIPVQSSGGFLFAESSFVGGGLCGARGRKIERAIQSDPDSLASRWRRVFCFEPAEAEGMPLVHTGYEPVESETGDCP